MKHMNAKALKPNKRHKILNDPNYVVEEKLKGIRAFLTFNGNNCILTSRGGHNISHRFPHLANIKIASLTGVTLDGELFQHGVEDEIIAGWGNHRTKHINPEVTKNVKFVAFDYYDSTYIQKARRKVLENISQLFPIEIQLIEQFPVIAAESIMNNILAMGGEGIMLKNIYAMYKPGKRLEYTWYKLKGEETFDVIITGFEMAKKMSIKKGDTTSTPTKFAGLIGAFKYGMILNGVITTLGTCSGMCDSVRIDMTENPDKWLGQVIEIKGVEQKSSGAIDNPRFIKPRPDKPVSECVWEKEE